MKPTTQRIASRALLVLASTLVSLLVLECVFRLVGVDGHYPAARVDRVIPGDCLDAGCVAGATTTGGRSERVDDGFVPHATVISTYASDPRGYFDDGCEVSHVHNSVGWRDQEHRIVRTEPTLRILGLGDSYLWGQGVHQGDRVLDLLEHRLAGDGQSRAIETINTALPGMNTWWQASTLRARGLAYDPDLVILFFVLNDVEEDLHGPTAKVEFFVNYTSVYQSPDTLSGYSQLWSWVRQRYLSTRGARAHIADSVASFHANSWKWQVCAGALDDIHRMLQARDIPMLLVLFPFFAELDGDYPFASIHDVVGQHAEQRGIPLLDLREAYRRFHGPELWVHETDQHPNEIAHAVAADAVHAFLEAHPELLSRER